MRPVLFGFHAPLVGEVTFPAYFTLLTLGFALAMVLTVRESRRLGMDHERILDTNLWMIVWGIIGARVLHLIADGHFVDYVHLCTNPKLVPAMDAMTSYCTSDAQCAPEGTFLGCKTGFPYICDLASHVCHPVRDCFAMLEVWRGGLAYYGGFIFAVAFAYYYVRKYKLGWWRTADLAAPGIMLGLFWGRLGCFLNGCCYGKPTSSRFGVEFPRGGAAWRQQVDQHLIREAQRALPVYPTQLYESLACLIIFAILYYVVRPRRRAFGQVFAAMLILYGIARSVVEVWRDDDRGVFFGGWLSTSQLISLPLIACGIVLLWRTTRHATVEGATPATG
jgi:phosphatidylglycerol:prolipoprotein diacylglycerol transferase